ncbi:MAG TPA: hypothetical protein VGL94_23815 [Ktedonobacteraceae bacterium]
MNDGTIAFGRKALQTGSTLAFLNLECLEDRSKRFNTVDALIGELLVRCLQGERVAELIQYKDREHSVIIHGLGTEHRTFVEDTFCLDRQQSRGAWFLPAEASLRVGMINLPANFRTYARFASTPTWEEHGKVSLSHSGDALLIWALLEPLFEALFQPFLLRGRLVGSKSREDQIKSWMGIDTLLEALGLSVSDELAIMRYGGGWHTLRSQEQLAAKLRLLKAFAHQVKPAMAAHYRAHRIHSLLHSYYKKAGKDGRVKRKQALTKSLERTMAGYFGGDWLAFLAYIGEEPHPEEQIITALPKTRLHIGGGGRAAEIAAQMGIAATEVERMMAAYWQQTNGVSPVEQRVDFLSRYWRIFDEIHTRQVVGMKPLWGLIEDHRPFDFFYHDPNLPYHPRLYLQLLPTSILSEIEHLWGTTMLPRWPDRMISEPSPHMAMAETLGPALRFWHGCALTAWFLCEGPSSRTDMAGLAEYYRREIKALEELNTPVDAQLFHELVKAEGMLGPPEPLTQNSSSAMTKSGIAVTVTMNSGVRREGFEKLRDILTRYRRHWTDEYFDHYLRMRWESEIRETGKVYNHLLNEGGKAPTPKQFAKPAAQATNHWFGGDLSGLYGAIQEKALVQPQRVSLLPTDRVPFAFAVFTLLGGNPSFRQERLNGSQQDYQARRHEWDQHAQLCDLAGLSFWYVQLEEGLGHAPEMKEFGLSKFSQLCPVVNEDVDKAWHIYREAIESAKQGRGRPQLYQVPESSLAPQSNRTLPVSQQVFGAPIVKSQPPEQKRSWLDRLLRRH